MEAEQRLRHLLMTRLPSVKFDSNDEVGAKSFFGSARSALEAKLDGARANTEEELGSPLHGFVTDIVSLQSGPDEVSHEDMARYMKDIGHSISSTRDEGGAERIVIKVSSNEIDLGRVVEAPVPNGWRERFGNTPPVHSGSALTDLAILLLLRFGAFDDSVDSFSGSTRSVVGANFAIDYLFKNDDEPHADLARAKLRHEMGIESTTDDLSNAHSLLTETHRLEDVERIVREKASRLYVATRWTTVESVSAAVLAVTVLLVVWQKGGAVLASHRVIAWIGTVSVLIYVVTRMLALHMPGLTSMGGGGD